MRKLGVSALCFAGMCVSEQICFATSINTVDDFKRFVYQNSWGAWASQKANNTYDKDGWYRKEMFSTSIYDEIQTAIADCMTVNNEFNLAAQKRKNDPNAIVEFTTDSATYNQNNWNAVVLYNYLSEAIWGFLFGWKHGYQGDCIDKVAALVKARYRNATPNIVSYIDTAVAVIKMYAKDLNLYDYVYRLQTRIQQPNVNYFDMNIGFDMEQNGYFDPLFKSATFCLHDVLTTIDETRHTPINVKIMNGKVVEYQTPYGVYTSMSKSMQLSNKKLSKLPNTYKYNDLTKQKKPEQIHNLHNIWTCHINSFITALSMSDLFRQAIHKVASMQTKTVQLGTKTIPLSLCKKINQMIKEGIDEGRMANNSDSGKQNYTKQHDELRKILSETIAVMNIKHLMNQHLDNNSWDNELNQITNGQGLDHYVQRIIKAQYKESTISPHFSSYELTIPDVLQAISYELDAYGVENILQHSLINIVKYTSESKTLEPIFSADFRNEAGTGTIRFACFEAFMAELNKNETNLGKVLQKLISLPGPRVETTVYLSTGTNIPVVRTFDSRIEELPDLLVVVMPNQNADKTKAKRTTELQLEDIVGAKHYRLVSEMLHLPGHYVAKVTLNDKPYIIDDTREDGNTAKEEKQFLLDYNEEPTHIERVDKPTMVAAIYERCG